MLMLMYLSMLMYMYNDIYLNVLHKYTVSKTKLLQKLKVSGMKSAQNNQVLVNWCKVHFTSLVKPFGNDIRQHHKIVSI